MCFIDINLGFTLHPLGCVVRTDGTLLSHQEGTFQNRCVSRAGGGVCQESAVISYIISLCDMHAKAQWKRDFIHMPTQTRHKHTREDTAYKFCMQMSFVVQAHQKIQIVPQTRIRTHMLYIRIPL